MRLSEAKDKVLKSLVNNDPPFKDLKINSHTINAALVDLAKGNYITIMETSGPGSGMVKTFLPQSVLPLGAHFFQTNKSFKREENWQLFYDVPKKFWFIAALFAVIVFALPLYLQYCKRPIQYQNQSMQK